MQICYCVYDSYAYDRAREHSVNQMSKRDPVFSPDKADKMCEVNPNIKHFITINVEGFSLVSVCGLKGKCILLLIHAEMSHSTKTCKIGLHIQGHSVHSELKLVYYIGSTIVNVKCVNTPKRCDVWLAPKP